MEGAPDVLDADEDARRLGLTVAGKGVVGYPGVAEEPTLPRAHGRLCKAFPLDLPMGVGDLYEERPRVVTPFEHAQHLLSLIHI